MSSWARWVADTPQLAHVLVVDEGEAVVGGARVEEEEGPAAAEDGPAAAEEGPAAAEDGPAAAEEVWAAAGGSWTMTTLPSYAPLSMSWTWTRVAVIMDGVESSESSWVNSPSLQWCTSVSVSDT